MLYFESCCCFSALKNLHWCQTHSNIVVWTGSFHPPHLSLPHTRRDGKPWGSEKQNTSQTDLEFNTLKAHWNQLFFFANLCKRMVPEIYIHSFFLRKTAILGEDESFWIKFGHNAGNWWGLNPFCILKNCHRWLYPIIMDDNLHHTDLKMILQFLKRPAVQWIKLRQVRWCGRLTSYW